MQDSDEVCSFDIQNDFRLSHKVEVEMPICVCEGYRCSSNWIHTRIAVLLSFTVTVLAIVMDNGNHQYYEEQVDKLARDIALAREKNYVVLIFQHEAICTGYPEDSKKKAFRVYDGEYRNFYDGCIGYDLNEDTPTTRVYQLLTENADVVRGLFCGHYHSAYYTEVKGSYIDENGVMQFVNIPQPVLTSSAYDDYAGYVMKITVI